MGVTIFSFGIGKEFKKDELDEMATDPDSKHVITGGFDELEQLLPKIKKMSCEGECTVLVFDVFTPPFFVLVLHRYVILTEGAFQHQYERISI